MSLRVELNRSAPLVADPRNGHNRWHPAIEPIGTVEPGDVIDIDTRDGIDGQVTMESTGADVAALQMERGHPLTGPFVVAGAEPGDLIVVETLDIEPDSFGFTVVRPGGGLLGDEVGEPLVVRWLIADGVARSPDIPGVTIAGEPFMGVVGVAPSPERMQAFTDRELALQRNGGAARLPDRTAAVPAEDPVAAEGLRTVPPRETGGNIDVKQAGIGSRLFLPVDVPGALLSVGDAHFAQGDGEVCSQAIEMHARARLRIDLVKASERRFRSAHPVVEFTAPARAARSYFATTGIPVDGYGANHHFDLYIAAQGAVREMIDYLVATRGFTREQAYALCSVAVDLHISEVVNTPNGVVAALLPLDVFDEDPSDQ